MFHHDRPGPAGSHGRRQLVVISLILVFVGIALLWLSLLPVPS